MVLFPVFCLFLLSSFWHIWLLFVSILQTGFVACFYYQRGCYSLCSHFLQCCMGFLLYCTFLHKIRLLKLLRRRGQGSFSIFSRRTDSRDPALVVFAERSKYFLRFAFPAVLLPFYLDLVFISLLFIPSCLIYIRASVIYFVICVCLSSKGTQVFVFVLFCFALVSSICLPASACSPWNESCVFIALNVQTSLHLQLLFKRAYHSF